ncbi:MAG: 3-deoxy-D-manno-octulosonic acid transferase, partial [Bacteroidetes bacterium]
QQDWKLLLVPHEVSDKHIQQLAARLPLPHLRYSKLSADSDLAGARVLILDTVGLLACAYAYGELAYVGGGFGSGLHNTLEPTAHALPVFFGPKYHRFPEAVHFVKAGGGFVVKDAQDFQQQFRRLSRNEAAYQQAVAVLRNYFAQARGATQRIMAGMERSLSSK